MKRIILTIIAVVGGALVLSLVLSNVLYGNGSAVIGMWMVFAILGYCFVAAKYNDVFDPEPKKVRPTYYAPPLDKDETVNETPPTDTKKLKIEPNHVQPEDGQSMIIMRVPKEPVHWAVKCFECGQFIRLSEDDVYEALLDRNGGIGPILCPGCDIEDAYVGCDVINETTGEPLHP